MTALRNLVVLAWVLLLASGCGGASRGNDQPPDFRELGTLPGLAQASDPALQDEFARLQAEGATPAQLVSATVSLPDDQNVAAGLLKVLSAEKVMRANNDVNDIYPRGKFVWTAGSLERARDLLKYHQPAHTAMRAALDREQCVYTIAYDDGLLADLTEFEAVRLAHRWEALDAAVQLTDGNIAQAEQCVQRMLRLDHQLSQTKHVIPRLQAATLRLEALDVLAVLVAQDQTNAAMLKRMYDALHEQLTQWPSEAAFWLGDRAIGLHAYEMIRQGYILSILNDEELAALRQKSSVSATARGVVKYLDQDERFYLENMRAMIAACDRPFYQRQELLTQVRDSLAATQDTEKYPLVAGQILLADMEAGQRRLAQERAACEGWLLGLAFAVQSVPPQFDLNPETGRPYLVQRESMRIVVRQALAGDELIVLPAF